MLSLAAGLEDPPVQLCPGNMTSMDKLRKPSFYFDQSLCFCNQKKGTFRKPKYLRNSLATAFMHCLKVKSPDAFPWENFGNFSIGSITLLSDESY